MTMFLRNGVFYFNERVVPSSPEPEAHVKSFCFTLFSLSMLLLRALKATTSYTEQKEVETRM